jgi:hypothetical protein
MVTIVGVEGAMHSSLVPPPPLTDRLSPVQNARQRAGWGSRHVTLYIYMLYDNSALRFDTVLSLQSNHDMFHLSHANTTAPMHIQNICKVSRSSRCSSSCSRKTASAAIPSQLCWQVSPLALGKQSMQHWQSSSYT